MNCKDVQELLPLYVGRDLEERRAKLVKAHVQSCVECAGWADEYRETHQLLQQFAPPPFSEAVYAGIRQRVFREIEREAAAPGLSRLLESLFRPRLRWALATALLLAVSLFALYFIASRNANLMNDRQQLADRSKVAAPTSTSMKENKGPSSVSVSIGRNARAGATIAGSVNRMPQAQRRKRSGVVADRTRSLAMTTPESRPMTAQTVPASNDLAEPDAVPTRDPATSEKTLRVEMQTRDPNIRIIWFAPQPTKQDSPGKFSKGI